MISNLVKLTPLLLSGIAAVPAVGHPPISTVQNTLSSTQEYLHISDLKAFGRSSTTDVNNYWNSKFGEYPDGWCINEDTYGQAAFYNNKNLCQVYNYMAYKNLGKQINKSNIIQADKTLTQTTVKNCGSTTRTQSVSLSSAMGYSASLSMSATYGLSWPGQIDLQFKAGGTTFHVSSSIGNSGSTSGSSSASGSTTVAIPPKKQVVIKLVGTNYSGTVDYTVPVTVSGYMYGNFQNPVCYNGSCANLWYDQIANAVNENRAEIFGVSNVSATMNAQISVGSFTDASC